MIEPPQGLRSFETGLVVPKVMWGAFAVTHLLFGGIGWYVRPSDPVEQPELIGYILAGLGSILPIAAPMVRKFFMARDASSFVGHEPATLLMKFFVPMILSFALAETGATFGLVLLLLGFEPDYWIVPATFGLVVHLALFPSVGLMRNWQERLRGHR